jgi:hypothetical protein
MRTHRDKPQAIWKRRGRSILPANDEAEAIMRSIKDGTECIGAFQTIRSTRQLRLYWGLMRLLVDNGIFPSLESASDATKIGAGHTDMRVMPDTGEVAFVPRHINFGSLSQAEFNEVFQQALAVICERWIPNRDDLLDTVEEMMTPPERKAFGRRVNARALEHAGENA